MKLNLIHWLNILKIITSIASKIEKNYLLKDHNKNIHHDQQLEFVNTRKNRKLGNGLRTFRLLQTNVKQFDILLPKLNWQLVFLTMLN